MVVLAAAEILVGEAFRNALHLQGLEERFDLNLVDLFDALCIFGLILVLSVVYRLSLKNVEDELIPQPRVSIKNILQTAVESLLSLVKSVMPNEAEKYLPLIGSLFIFIFLSNLLGLIPGFLPPTHNLSDNLALGLTVYVFYNAMGIRSVGFTKYMAHFMGPVWWMAPLLFVIEIFSHAIRPISLSFRLFANINGDHLVVDAISQMVPLGIPTIFLAFGIFVSFIQAFVFTLLSTIYISMAVETHGHDDHHATGLQPSH